MSRITRERNVTVLETSGNYSSLDMHGLESFGGALLSEAIHAQPPALVVDLAKTSFIGSSFIELLVRAWKRVRERQGMMALCNLQPLCVEVLRVSRLDQVFPQRPTRDEAIEAVLAGLSEPS